MEYFNSRVPVRLCSRQFCMLLPGFALEIVHQPVNFITSKIYSYAGITEHFNAILSMIVDFEHALLKPYPLQVGFLRLA